MQQPFSTEANEILKRFRTRLETDPLFWANYYFPKRMWRQPAFFQLEIIEEATLHKLHKDGRSYLSIAAPRGSAKSELIVFVYLLHCIVYKKKRHIVVISNTFAKAAKHLENIKMELRENRDIIKDFPGISIPKDAEGDSIIKHTDGFQTRILCKGVDQVPSVRGEKFGHYRPDLIIGDDMEDDEMVKSPERRKDFSEDFDTALVPAGDTGTQYIFIGTVLHDDCQIARLVSSEYYPQYTKLFYKALINEGKQNEESLWPAKWTVDDLHDMMKHDPLMFAKEMQNDPVSAGNQRFSRKDFRYWNIEGDQYILYGENGKPISIGKMKDCKAAIACDLAWKEKREADRTVLMPGFLTPGNELLIDQYVHRIGVRPDEFSQMLFAMEERLRRITGGTVFVGFEKAMLENVTQWILKQKMREKNHWISTKELVWDADKLTRIETRLHPRYAQHIVFHRQGMGDLEYQLERFPSNSKDDLLDAEQGLVQLLKHPKVVKNPDTDDAFEWFRDLAIKAKKPEPTHFVFGNKGKKYKGIPAHRTWR